MSMESPGEGNALEKKFDELSEKADAQIKMALTSSGKNMDAPNIDIQADNIFQDYYMQASNVYFSIIDDIEKLPAEDERVSVIRDMVARMSQCFSRDGYVEEVTANRLAAAMTGIFEEYEEEEE